MTQELESFEFALDRKVTTWMRTTFTVRATSLDEAKRMVKDDCWTLLHADIDRYEQEIDFSQYEMTPEENGGQYTKIWSCLDDGDDIFDNSGKKED